MYRTWPELSDYVVKLPVWILLAAGLFLSSCQTGNLGSIAPNRPASQTQNIIAQPNGEIFGLGKTRVALLVPKTASGNGARVAQEIRNGALLALKDFGQNTVQLVIKDTRGEATDTQNAAAEAVKEGASAILGPLFSANVNAAAAVTVPAGRPIIAFSTDVNVARRGVYLMSFTPQDDVRRIITHAASQGRRSIIAFLPSNAYGSVVEGALRQVAGRSGMDIISIIRYERTGAGIETAVREASTMLEATDSIYIPEGGGVPGTILASIKRLGVSLEGKQIIGSGRWESVKLGDPLLTGAIYPGRDITKFKNFSDRYQSAYGVMPGVNAAIGYDALTLTVELIRRHGDNAFRPNIIENTNGFAGVNGIFRFRRQGTAERGLAVYQVINGLGQLLVPAPGSFGFRS